MRSSGILLPISSLPSPYGIGTFGKEAYKFADFLKECGQKYWQILPLGPTGYGDSPYQSFSTFAGNPYFIDLDELVEDGLIKKADLKNTDWGDDPRYVDYGKIYNGRFAILKKACETGSIKYAEDIRAFREKEGRWLEEYALFMSLKKHFGMKAFIDWDDKEAAKHKPEALGKYRELLKDDIDFYVFMQFLFFKQWSKLKEYVNGLGIQIIGDLPIYVSPDGADVWSEPEFFELDEENIPTFIAGVPPDYFCEDGQLWGNPLYNWERMRQDGFGWWIRRIDMAGRLYDVIRLDHFIGFENFWAVPYGSETAKTGEWRKGPGMELIGVLKGWFRNINFIAEDLGELNDAVRKLLSDSGFPGMKVLEFSFNGEHSDNENNPYGYKKNLVCYTGTHDNMPLAEWIDDVDKKVKDHIFEYFGISKGDDYVWSLIRGAMSSVADLCVVQIQDYLGYGAGHRINCPGNPMGNWTWRLVKGDIKKDLTKKIRHITELYGRASE